MHIENNFGKVRPIVRPVLFLQLSPLGPIRVLPRPAQSALLAERSTISRDPSLGNAARSRNPNLAEIEVHAAWLRLLPGELAALLTAEKQH